MNNKIPHIGDFNEDPNWYKANKQLEALRLSREYRAALADRSLPIRPGDMPQQDYPDLRSVERVEPYLYVCTGIDMPWLTQCLAANQTLIGKAMRTDTENGKMLMQQEAQHHRVIISKDGLWGFYTTIPMPIVNVLSNLVFTSIGNKNGNFGIVSPDMYENFKQGYKNWQQFQEAEDEYWD